MEGLNLGILIPAYNEDQTVKEVISEAKKFGTVIISDDYSVDDTKYLSKKAGAHVINNKFEKGYEGNLKTLLKFAAEEGNFTHFITIDADGELPASEIRKFIDISKSCDLCIGQRDKFNRIVEFILGIYFNFRYGIRDPISGMKFYSKDLLVDFYKDSRELNLGTSIIKFCKINNYKIGTNDIKVKKRKDISRFGDNFFTQLKMTRTVFKDFL